LTKTIDIDIVYNGNKEVVTIKKLNWGERNQVIEDTIGTVKVLGGEIPQMEINQTKWRNSLFLHSIVKAPFAVNLETLNSLETDVTDPLFKEVMALNPFRELF
jgi:hypothetical protein